METLGKLDLELVKWLEETGKIFAETLNNKALIIESYNVDCIIKMQNEWLTIFSEPLDLPTSSKYYGESSRFDEILISSSVIREEKNGELCHLIGSDDLLGRVVYRTEYVETGDADEEGKIPYEYITYIHKVEVFNPINPSDYYFGEVDNGFVFSSMLKELKTKEDQLLFIKRWDLFRAYIALKAAVKHIGKGNIFACRDTSYFENVFVQVDNKDSDFLSVCHALGGLDLLKHYDYCEYEETVEGVVGRDGAVNLTFELPCAFKDSKEEITLNATEIVEREDVYDKYLLARSFKLEAQDPEEFFAEISVYRNSFKGTRVLLYSKKLKSALGLGSKLPLYAEAVRRWIVANIGNVPITWDLWSFFNTFEVDLKGDIKNHTQIEVATNIAEYGFTPRLIYVEFPAIS